LLKNKINLLEIALEKKKVYQQHLLALMEEYEKLTMDDVRKSKQNLNK
jgi:hypothetical protein